MRRYSVLVCVCDSCTVCTQLQMLLLEHTVLGGGVGGLQMVGSRVKIDGRKEKKRKEKKRKIPSQQTWSAIDGNYLDSVMVCQIQERGHSWCRLK